MADQPKMDIVMRFVQKDGKGPVLAECALDKDPDDTFMTDFNPATYKKYSDFFEITKFQFGIELKDEDSTKGRTQSGGTMTASPVAKEGTKKTQGAFASWRSATRDQVPDVKFPLEFDTFSFTRLIDRASPIFFEACCSSLSFLSATLVKRVSVGHPLAKRSSMRMGNTSSVGFLRIDFKDVLIIGLDWDDGDLISESCKFICKGFDLKYRKQLTDGSLENKVVNASWDYKQNALSNQDGE